MRERVLVFVGFVVLLFVLPPLFAADAGCSVAPPESEHDYVVASLAILGLFAAAYWRREPKAEAVPE